MMLSHPLSLAQQNLSESILLFMPLFQHLSESTLSMIKMSRFLSWSPMELEISGSTASFWYANQLFKLFAFTNFALTFQNTEVNAPVNLKAGEPFVLFIKYISDLKEFEITLNSQTFTYSIRDAGIFYLNLKTIKVSGSADLNFFGFVVLRNKINSYLCM